MRLLIGLAGALLPGALAASPVTPLGAGDRLDDVPREQNVAAMLVLEQCPDDAQSAERTLWEFDNDLYALPIMRQGAVVGVNGAEHVTGAVLASLPEITVESALASLAAEFASTGCRATTLVGRFAAGSRRPADRSDPSSITGVVLHRLADDGFAAYRRYYEDIQPLYAEHGFRDLAIAVDLVRHDSAGGIRGLETPDIALLSQVFRPETTFPAYRADPRFPGLSARRADALESYVNFVGRLMRAP